MGQLSHKAGILAESADWGHTFKLQCWFSEPIFGVFSTLTISDITTVLGSEVEISYTEAHGQGIPISDSIAKVHALVAQFLIIRCRIELTLQRVPPAVFPVHPEPQESIQKRRHPDERHTGGISFDVPRAFDRWAFGSSGPHIGLRKLVNSLDERRQYAREVPNRYLDSGCCSSLSVSGRICWELSSVSVSFSESEVQDWIRGDPGRTQAIGKPTMTYRPMATRKQLGNDEFLHATDGHMESTDLV